MTPTEPGYVHSESIADHPRITQEELEGVDSATRSSHIPDNTESALSYEPPMIAPRSLSLEDQRRIPILGTFRMIGYALILLALIDLIYAIIPPKFTDPIWEFQTIGDWFERIPVLMLGFVFAFQQGGDFRNRVEKHFLRILSWITLPLGICFLLLLPLCINDAAQINRLNNAEINGQINEQIVQLDQAKKKILNASEEQLKTLLLPADKAAKVPGAPRTPQVAKEVALNNLGDAEKRGRNQAEEARQNLKRNLLKNTIRLLLGCVISSFTLCYFWKNTKWARDFRSYRNEIALPTRTSQKSLGKGQKSARARKAQSYITELPP